MKLHVIIASHNRRDLTVNAVTRAVASANLAGVEVTFTIYDDGSTDGTAQALRGLSLPITILMGTGSAYWARSMSIAESSAMRSAEDGDWIVWMNDDVVLDEGAFGRAVRFLRMHPDSVFVASFVDPENGSITYGGYQRYSKWHPLHCRLVQPSENTPIPIDTMNGNLVFVPVPVIRRIGGIDGDFAHAAADTDYGLRCGKSGVPLLLLPGSAGTCLRDGPAGSSIMKDWLVFISVKGGGHPTTLRRMLRRHAAPTWAVLWISAYVLWWLRRLARPIRSMSTKMLAAR